MFQISAKSSENLSKGRAARGISSFDLVNVTVGDRDSHGITEFKPAPHGRGGSFRAPLRRKGGKSRERGRHGPTDIKISRTHRKNAQGHLGRRKSAAAPAGRGTLPFRSPYSPALRKFRTGNSTTPQLHNSLRLLLRLLAGGRNDRRFAGDRFAESPRLRARRGPRGRAVSWHVPRRGRGAVGLA